jgi:short-subunit dehydrogenase
MKAQKSGKIVIISSISGVADTPRHAHYSAAKGWPHRSDESVIPPLAAE